MEWTRVSITRPLLSGPTDFLFHPGQSYSIIVPEPYLTLTRYRHRHLATELRLFLDSGGKVPSNREEEKAILLHLGLCYPCTLFFQGDGNWMAIYFICCSTSIVGSQFSKIFTPKWPINFLLT